MLVLMLVLIPQIFPSSTLLKTDQTFPLNTLSGLHTSLVVDSTNILQVDQRDIFPGNRDFLPDHRDIFPGNKDFLPDHRDILSNHREFTTEH